MDTSETFNKMLDKAIESEPLAFKNFDRTKNVQDQLQEMVESKQVTPEMITFGKLAYFAFWVRYRCPEPFTSMEQLWLAFLYAGKYNKVWNGEEWIKESQK